MKLQKKYAAYIFATIMAIAMGFFMSFFLTWINTGFTNNFILRWLKSFALGVLIAFPTSLIVAPIAQRIVKKVIRDN